MSKRTISIKKARRLKKGCKVPFSHNLCQHSVDIGRGEIKSRGGTDDCQLLAHIAKRLTTMCLGEGLSNPFGDRHMARACGSSDPTILGVFEYDLESLRHTVSVSDSSI